ncbi:MAG: hypothetical protein KDC34_18790 [Saprospiraceae bacterium]|nr:hypothetical protein [Saprospiraceae bacterium]
MNFDTISTLKRPPFYLYCILFMMTLSISCSPKDDDDPGSPTCYRCIYAQSAQTLCDSVLVYEACILGAYQNSIQMNIAITEKCNGGIVNTSQEIGFIEDFLIFHETAGASCEEF